MNLKTTLPGIGVILTVLFHAWQTKTFDSNTFAALTAGIGLIAAKDHDKK